MYNILWIHGGYIKRKTAAKLMALNEEEKNEAKKSGLADHSLLE